jgi:hypothetical protein
VRKCLDGREETARLAWVGAAGGSGEQARGGELLCGEQLATHLGRVQLAAHALGGRGGQTGRRDSGCLGQGREILEQVEQPLQDERAVGWRDQEGQRGSEVGRALGEREIRQRG